MLSFKLQEIATRKKVALYMPMHLKATLSVRLFFIFLNFITSKAFAKNLMRIIDDDKRF